MGTRLNTFSGKSGFRTWLYRVAINHLLNVRKSETKEKSITFTDMGASLDRVPDLDLPDPNELPIETALLVEEAKLGCITAMLMCLDRRHRLAFILGEVFGETSEAAGQFMEVTPANSSVVVPRAA